MLQKYAKNLSCPNWSVIKLKDIDALEDFGRSIVNIKTTGCEYCNANGSKWFLAVYRNVEQPLIGQSINYSCHGTAPSCDNCSGQIEELIVDVIDIEVFLREEAIMRDLEDADLMRRFITGRPLAELVLQKERAEHFKHAKSLLPLSNPDLRYFWRGGKLNDVDVIESTEIHILSRMSFGETPGGNDCDVAVTYCNDHQPMYSYGWSMPWVGARPENVPICLSCIDEYYREIAKARCPKCGGKALCSHKEIGVPHEYHDRYEVRCLECDIAEFSGSPGGNTEQQSCHTLCLYCGQSSATHDNGFVS